MMPEDLKELLRAFNDQAVKFLIVGGYAFGVHAEPRATKDLDIFVRSDEDNSKAIFRALAQYGAPLGGLNPSDFMDGTTFQIGRPWHADGEVFHHEPTAPRCHRFCGFHRPSADGDYPVDCAEWHPRANCVHPF
jgi:hypothetical protein